MSEQVNHIVWEFELLDFAHCFITMLVAPLLTAFVERWHKETSSFHLLFGQMTITLDDVSILFHLPIGDKFWTTFVISMSLACMAAARDLGVSEPVVKNEFDINRGVHLHMYWFRNTHDKLVATGSYEVVAMVYMLHLVACTLFVDKSGVYFDARYMCLFNSLEVTSWAWGCDALTILYTTLEVMIIFETRQPASYLSLLQVYLKLLFVVDFLFNYYEYNFLFIICCVCILILYEYFPTICDRRVKHSSMGAPRARRWNSRQSHPGGVVEYKRRLDVLNVDDVIWIPYTDHKVHSESEESSLYSGYMWWETMVVGHLLERCLRQYVMFRVSHNQFQIYQLRIVPLEIEQLGFSTPHNVRMVTWSGTSLYHTLESSHVLRIQVMLGLLMSGYLLLMCPRRLLQLMSMNNSASRWL